MTENPDVRFVIYLVISCVIDCAFDTMIISDRFAFRLRYKINFISVTLVVESFHFSLLF